MIPRAWIVTGLLTCAMCGAAAQADEIDGRPGRLKNGHWFQHDTDRDGKISFEEFRLAQEKQIEARFRKIDLNSDGSIERSEIKEARRRMRERFHGPKERR